MKFALTGLLAASAFVPNLALAAPFSMAIVADNDFAIFTGTATGVNNLLYQNNVSWEQQIPSLTTLQFDMPAGDTMFYLLGIGGGGEENISGKINGVDIATMSVQMSSNLALSGWTPGAVAAGTYNASLADVQSNFPQLTWGATTTSTTQTVIAQAAPNKIGYTWASNTAHLFRFDATAAGVSVPPEPSGVPEPSTYALALLGLAAAGAVKRKRRVSV